MRLWFLPIARPPSSKLDWNRGLGTWISYQVPCLPHVQTQSLLLYQCALLCTKHVLHGHKLWIQFLTTRPTQLEYHIGFRACHLCKHNSSSSINAGRYKTRLSQIMVQFYVSQTTSPHTRILVVISKGNMTKELRDQIDFQEEMITLFFNLFVYSQCFLLRLSKQKQWVWVSGVLDIWCFRQRLMRTR